jgi:hypothetical protein
MRKHVAQSKYELWQERIDVVSWYHENIKIWNNKILKCCDFLKLFFLKKSNNSWIYFSELSYSNTFLSILNTKYYGKA